MFVRKTNIRAHPKDSVNFLNCSLCSASSAIPEFPTGLPSVASSEGLRRALPGSIGNAAWCGDLAFIGGDNSVFGPKRRATPFSVSRFTRRHRGIRPDSKTPAEHASACERLPLPIGTELPGTLSRPDGAKYLAGACAYRRIPPLRYSQRSRPGSCGRIAGGIQKKAGCAKGGMCIWWCSNTVWPLWCWCWC